MKYVYEIGYAAQRENGEVRKPYIKKHILFMEDDKHFLISGVIWDMYAEAEKARASKNFKELMFEATVTYGDSPTLAEVWRVHRQHGGKAFTVVRKEADNLIQPTVELAYKAAIKKVQSKARWHQSRAKTCDMLADIMQERMEVHANVR
jgi:hypothetical protein